MWAWLANQEQTLSGTGACVYTAHKGCLGYQYGLDWGFKS